MHCFLYWMLLQENNALTKEANTITNTNRHHHPAVERHQQNCTFSTGIHTHKETNTHTSHALTKANRKKNKKHCWKPFLFLLTPLYFRVFVRQRICNAEQNNKLSSNSKLSLSLTYKQKQKKTRLKKLLLPYKQNTKKNFEKNQIQLSKTKKNEVNHLVEKKQNKRKLLRIERNRNIQLKQT